jgi:lipoprotein-anchoring transpeptidase ErfK/SrfK
MSKIYPYQSFLPKIIDIAAFRKTRESKNKNIRSYMYKTNMSTDTIANVLNGEIIANCFNITSNTDKLKPNSKASVSKSLITLSCKRCSEIQEYQIRNITMVGKVKCQCHKSHRTIESLFKSSTYVTKTTTTPIDIAPVIKVEKVAEPIDNKSKTVDIAQGIPFNFQMIDGRLSRKCCDNILYSPKVIHLFSQTPCQFCPNYQEKPKRIILSKFHKDLTKKIMTQQNQVDRYHANVIKIKTGLAFMYFDEDEDVYHEYEKLQGQFDLNDTYDFKMADKLESLYNRYEKTHKPLVIAFLKENNAQEFVQEMTDTIKKLHRAQRHLATLKKCYGIKSKKSSDALIKDIMNNIDTFCPQKYNDKECEFTAFNKDIIKLDGDNMYKCSACTHAFHLDEKAIKLTLNSTKSCPFCFPIPESDPHQYLENTETPTFNYNYIRIGKYSNKK